MSRVRAPTSGVSATGERGATAADPTRNLPPQPVRRRRLLSREEGGRRRSEPDPDFAAPAGPGNPAAAGQRIDGVGGRGLRGGAGGWGGGFAPGPLQSRF